MSKPLKPRRGYLRFMRVVLIVLIVDALFLVALTLVTDYPNYAAPTIPGLLWNLIRVELATHWFQILQGIFFLLFFLSLNQRIIYRQGQQDQAEQMHNPAPALLLASTDSASALPLPYHVWIRAAQRTRWVQFSSSLVVMTIFLIAILASWKKYDPWVSITALSICAGAIATVNILMPVLLRSHLTFTEQGASLSQAGSNRRIAWQDARLFVVRAFRESAKGRVEQYYILQDVSGRKVIWKPLDQRLYQVFTSQQRPLTNEQFNAEIIPQINALVVARTGLVLIDQRVDAAATMPDRVHQG